MEEIYEEWYVMKLIYEDGEAKGLVMYEIATGRIEIVRAKAVMDVMEKRGVPNYIGDQRFGYRQNSHRTGKALLLGDFDTVVEEMLAADAPSESEYVKQGREFVRAGEYVKALEVWPKTLRYDRQLLDALRQGKSPCDAVKTIDGNQRAFLVSAWQSAVHEARHGSWQRQV